MKKYFASPELDIILLANQDIITASTSPENTDKGDNSGDFTEQPVQDPEP